MQYSFPLRRLRFRARSVQRPTCRLSHPPMRPEASVFTRPAFGRPAPAFGAHQNEPVTGLDRRWGKRSEREPPLAPGSTPTRRPRLSSTARCTVPLGFSVVGAWACRTGAWVDRASRGAERHPGLVGQLSRAGRKHVVRRIWLAADGASWEAMEDAELPLPEPVAEVCVMGGRVDVRIVGEDPGFVLAEVGHHVVQHPAGRFLAAVSALPGKLARVALARLPMTPRPRAAADGPVPSSRMSPSVKGPKTQRSRWSVRYSVW